MKTRRWSQEVYRQHALWNIFVYMHETYTRHAILDGLYNYYDDGDFLQLWLKLTEAYKKSICSEK